jgi:phosphoribosyl 1,2-cyclic phosphodiesterase
MSSSLTFLGTAGTRYVVIRQQRASGGLWLEADGTRVLIDPGPGSLLRCLQNDPPLDPEKLDAVILTHKHIDHANDVNIMVEAMTVGGSRPEGTLLVPADAVAKEAPSVLPYVRDYVRRLEILEANRSYPVNGVSVETGPRHLHPVETYGLRFRLPELTLGLVVDTRWFDDLPTAYEGCDVLVVNTVLMDPVDTGSIFHLAVSEAERLIEAVRPGKALLTHFGRSVLAAGPRRVAAELSDRTGVEVEAAEDGRCYRLTD